MTNAPTRAEPDLGTEALPRIAVLGNPNTGKTTLFNRLCGLRARTANFPGSTVESRIGVHRAGTRDEFELVDLPGTYSLTLDLPEARICRDCIEGRLDGFMPDALLVVVDGTNLRRNLQFAAQVLVHPLPAVVAVNMADRASAEGLEINAGALSARLGCPVVLVSARTGAGLAALDVAMDTVAEAPLDADALRARHAKIPPLGTPVPALAAWADEVVREAVHGRVVQARAGDTLRDRLDLAFTHPVLGVACFVLMMAALFAAIFVVANVPMDLIDSLFGAAAEAVATRLPPGILNDLLTQGVILGVASVLVFLPQICLLFFLLTLLEDSGYLARAAFAMDRVMSRFGLTGLAFVPLLSSHACALPGIMGTRLIPDERDRLATILVAPFMSCSARLPVYVLLIGVLTAGRPAWVAGVAFVGCYALGAMVGLLSAWVARGTLLRGPARPMVLELPAYKVPSLRTALLTTYDRAAVFVRNAGTIILAISIVMWWLGAFPRAEEAPEAAALRGEAAALTASGDAGAAEHAAELEARAEGIQDRVQKEQSLAGRIGRVVQPVFAPLGMDSQLTIGVLSSFLAREVFVTTMAVLEGEGSHAEIGDESVLQRVRSMQRADATPVFNGPTALATLVFFVLAMQCLPTLAVTRRETGSWKWPAVQFAWMSTVAYAAAFLAYRVAGGA
jgi:ferrous iron transport protein B